MFDMLKSLVYVPADRVPEAFNLVIRNVAYNADGSEKFAEDSAETKFIAYYFNVCF